MIEVRDLRGLELSDPARKSAYPTETFELGQPMRYLHLENTRWYFDASKPENSAEADAVIAGLCFRAETGKPQGGYKPFRVVVDNFGGTIVGIHSSAPTN